MSSSKEITIHRIAQTQVNHDEVRKWLTELGFDQDSVYDNIPDDLSDPALLVALAAKRCYLSFEVGVNPNITQVRKDYHSYFENLMRSGHGSVLEHSVFTYAIENVSRVFTAEMNRHRAGWAISEGSLRFIRFNENIPFWMPLCFQPSLNDDADLANRKLRSREVFFEAFDHQEVMYGDLVNIWDMDASHHNFAYKKKITSALRRIVGMGVCTGGVWSGNMRALRHVLTMRCSEHAEEEICHVFSRIASHIAIEQPHIFGDFQIDENGFWRPRYVKV
jgi:thymidylate synthase (FAD)